MRLLIFLCFFSSLFAAQRDIDVEMMLEQIKPIEQWPWDLPNSPLEGITRNTNFFTISPNVTLMISIPAVASVICAGCPFQITAMIMNETGSDTAYDVISLTGLVPISPNIFYNSIASISPGTTFTNTGTSTPCTPFGTGTWTFGLGGAPIPPGTTSLVLNCTTTAVVSAVGIFNSAQLTTTLGSPPPQMNCISNSTTLVPTPVANNYSGSVCNNSVLNGTLTASSGTPPLNFSIVTSPPPSQGTISLQSDGSFQFTPNPLFSGTASFTFNVSDSNGCPSTSTGCPPGTATGNITVYTSPTSMPYSATSCSDAALSGSLAPLVSGGTPPYLFSVVGSPDGGTVSLDPHTGNFTFTVTPGFSGSGGFTYAATDANNCTTTNTATFTFATPEPNVFVGPYQIIYVGAPCN